MSLDVLFTEAAEAGGPPRFTEDDVEHRVGTRRRRRRALVGGGAAAVVVLAAGIAVALVNRDSPDSVVAGPAEGPVAADPVGARWVATGPIVEGYVLQPWIELYEDGTATAAASCGQNSFDWTRSGDDVTFRFTGDEPPFCPEEHALVESALEGITTARLTGDELVVEYPPDDVVFRRFEDLGSVPAAEDLRGVWFTDLGAFLVDADATLRQPPWCDDTGNCLGIPDELGARQFTELRLDGDRLYLIGSDAVATASRATPASDLTTSDVERMLADAFAAMAVEACCGEPSHGSPVTTSGFAHDGVEVSVVAGPVGTVGGFIRYASVEAVLDQRATFSQADGWIMVGFACGDLVVALSPYAPDYGGDSAVIVAAAERLIDAIPCEAQPVGLP